MSCALSQLADVAANLFISLPDSPQGKPFIDRAEAGSPAALLRAMRKRLNLTQREMGQLLAPPGGSPISPSVICQLESALQSVPDGLVERAVAATTAAQKLGEHLCSLPESKALDAASALKTLGPGCIDELQSFITANSALSADETAFVKEFLSIVTKRRHSTGGSRPGARGPYRKLSKVSAKSFPAPGTPNGNAASALAVGAASGSSSFSSPSGATMPAASTASHLGDAEPNADADGAAASGGCCSSGRSTPCSTPGSSRGSSRPRSPTTATGYESETKSPRLLPPSLSRDCSNSSLRSDVSAASSPAFTPGGTVVGLGTPTPGSASSLLSQNGEVSLEVLLALRKLQEENDTLQQENRRLREAGEEGAKPSEVEDPALARLVEAPAEVARADISMSC
jgi:hypothetical protein